MTTHPSTRRSILGSGIAMGLWIASGRPLTAAPAAAPIVARITLEGKVYEFHENRGRELGDYVGRSFVQRCVLVTVPDLPMSVFLRPDRDLDRVEVVFELGRMWNEPPRHLGHTPLRSSAGIASSLRSKYRSTIGSRDGAGNRHRARSLQARRNSSPQDCCRPTGTSVGARRASLILIPLWAWQA